MTSGCAGDGHGSDALFVCIPVVYCVENVGFGVMHCLFICLSVYKWRLLTVQNLPFGSYTDNLEEFKVCVCVCVCVWMVGHKIKNVAELLFLHI